MTKEEAEKARRKKINDDYMVQELFETLMTSYVNSKHRHKVEIITKAFNYANLAHSSGKPRKDGSPYITHPLQVAIIISNEMKLGSTSICAALLHDVVEDTEYPVTAQDFGNQVALIVKGVTKIPALDFANVDDKQVDNMRLLLLTMCEDVRVAIIKIADRLHNMRTLDWMAPDKQQKITAETMNIYAPIAHRLGFFAVKSELEDLSFKYEHPEEYQLIREKVAVTQDKRLQTETKFAVSLQEALKAKPMTYKINARVKSVYSIWKKMRRYNVPFDEIYDVFALRIVFDPVDYSAEKGMCWEIYTNITSIYKSKRNRLRDYITRPKPNGYQALHLTVMGPDGKWIEVQIRSTRMHEIDENGLAAHWKYQEDKLKPNKTTEDYNYENTTHAGADIDQWLKSVKEILKNPGEGQVDKLKDLILSFYSIEVFTPKGEIRTIPRDSTVLDFAYALHTNLGNTCVGAKVNRKLLPPNYVLEMGDQVEIVSVKTQTPQPEWLNFVVTPKARTLIERGLRRAKEEHAKAGEIMLLNAFEKKNIEASQSHIDRVKAHYGFIHREDFFAAISKGVIVLPEDISSLLKNKKSNNWTRKLMRVLGGGDKQSSDSEQPANETPTDEPEPDKFDRKKTYELREDALCNRNYIAAKCCNPIPGDNVFGFVKDNKLIVHKTDCPEGQLLKSSLGEHIRKTVWSSHVNNSFEATIAVNGIDRVGILMDISKTISEFNINIISLHVEVKGSIFECSANMLVHDVCDVKKIIKSFLKLENIHKAYRVE
ncbi:MAG: RelA/SpoT family protein [Tannerella sp.]|jgi:GTP pyrophosphokinase|nr:RelA/SpoT family protein [Tannerella sp.]